MKYYNEMKLEILNTPENIEFAKNTAASLASHMNIEKTGFDTIKNMVEEVVDDFKQTYGEHKAWIGLRMIIDGLDVTVESFEKKE